MKILDEVIDIRVALRTYLEAGEVDIYICRDNHASCKQYLEHYKVSAHRP